MLSVLSPGQLGLPGEPGGMAIRTAAVLKHPASSSVTELHEDGVVVEETYKGSTPRPHPQIP